MERRASFLLPLISVLSEPSRNRGIAEGRVAFRHLRYFVAVAEEGSITGAAKRLRVAQPALSRLVHNLETEIGAPLFQRERNGVHLTPVGDALLSGVRPLFDRLALLVNRTRLSHDGLLGQLRLGLARAALESKRVSTAIAQLRDSYPQVDLSVTEIAPFTATRLLREGALDVAIAAHGSEEDPAIRREVLFADVIDCAIIPRTHPLAGAPSISFDQLRDLPLAMIAPAKARGFSKVYDAVRARTEIQEHDRMDSVFSLVAAGRGWTVGPGFFRRNPPLGCAVVRLQKLRVPLEVSMQWRASDRSQLIDNTLRTLRSSRTSGGSKAPSRAARAGENPNPRVLASPELRVELPHLRAFVATIETGSFSAAGERLGLTQSAVSRQVRGLERIVGCALLDRGTHGVLVTRAGDVLRGEAQRVLTLAASAIASSRRIVGGHSGHCTVGAVPNEITRGLIGLATDMLADRYPGVSVELQEMLSPLQIVALRKGEIDVALAGGYPGLVDGTDLTSIELSDDPFECALLSASHRLASRTMLKPADLADEPFLFGARSVAPKPFDLVMGALADLGITPRIEGTFNGARAIWKFAGDGVGWSLGLRSQRWHAPPGLIGVPIEGLSIPWGIRLVWRHGETDQSVLNVVSVFRAAASR
jgi:DNA-binding transcriptional LysR family regulator